MYKFHKLLTGILASVLFVLTATMCFSSAASPVTADDATVLDQAALTEANVYAAQSTAPESPTWTYTQYNTAVKYVWQVGAGGTEIAMSPGSDIFYRMGSTTFIECTFPRSSNDIYCKPQYYEGKSYDSSTGLYSYATTLRYELDMGDYISVRYGFDAKYTVKNLFAYWLFDASKKVPTSYDEDYFVWTHGAGYKDILKATICYNGIMKDLEVRVPMMTTNSAFVNIGDETFYFRTGPNKCSIKSKNSNIRAIDIQFAYGIQGH